VVSSLDVCRQNAEECLGWARTARTDRERDIFLQIARAWNEAAEKLDGKDEVGFDSSEARDDTLLTAWRVTIAASDPCEARGTRPSLRIRRSVNHCTTEYMSRSSSGLRAGK
jgi:hypothetical protein